jgi:predicted MFS family arabinose efflux permease
MFLAFAFAYFLSTLVRAVTATLAPTLRTDLGLTEGDLGLLAGAYFAGFALTQLPLGAALDRHGPRRVLCVLLVVASVASVLFAQAESVLGLTLARLLIGVGVSACLMAPLTAYRLRLAPDQQLRANAWMLMTGSLGMLASTLPVQYVMPWVGWRGVFLGIAALLLVAVVAVYALTPKLNAGPQSGHPSGVSGDERTEGHGYWRIFTHPRFVQVLPAALFIYGGTVSLQTLWIGPWLTRVTGLSAQEAAQGLFFINLATLVSFFLWGVVTPRMARAGVNTYRVILYGLPLPLALLAINVLLGERTGAWGWGAWLVASSVINLSQPLLAQEFPKHVAGRALTAFNLLLFVGVFFVQWGIGLVIDALLRTGWGTTAAYQGAMGLFFALCFVAYAWYAVCERRQSAKGAPTAAHNPSA